jgi:hypothetical protein
VVATDKRGEDASGEGRGRHGAGHDSGVVVGVEVARAVGHVIVSDVQAGVCRLVKEEGVHSQR